jgi:hypothetical protein
LDRLRNTSGVKAGSHQWSAPPRVHSLVRLTRRASGHGTIVYGADDGAGGGEADGGRGGADDDGGGSGGGASCSSTSTDQRQLSHGTTHVLARLKRGCGDSRPRRVAKAAESRRPSIACWTPGSTSWTRPSTTCCARGTRTPSRACWAYCNSEGHVPPRAGSGTPARQEGA